MSAGAIWVAVPDQNEVVLISKIGARLGLKTHSATSDIPPGRSLEQAHPLCAVVDPVLRTPLGRTLIEHAWDQTWPMPALVLTASEDAALITSLLQTPLITALARPFAPAMLEAALVRLASNAQRLRHQHMQRCHARERIHRLPVTCRSILADVLRSEPIKRIARRHDLSTRTIEVRKKALFDQLGVGTYAELFELCFLAGISS